MKKIWFPVAYVYTFNIVNFLFDVTVTRLFRQQLSKTHFDSSFNARRLNHTFIDLICDYAMEEISIRGKNPYS